MCTQFSDMQFVSAYLARAHQLLNDLHGDDFHAHGLAIQRLVRFLPGAPPTAVTLAMAQGIIALEADFASWDELEHNLAFGERIDMQLVSGF